MIEKPIEEETKNRSTPTYSVIRDPVNVIDHLEDKTAISYTPEEMEVWVKTGGLPRDLGSLGLEQIASLSVRVREAREMVERVKKEGREPTREDWIEFAKKHKTNTEDIKKNIALHEFLIKNREHLLNLLKAPAAKKKKIRHSGHFLDQKLKYTMPDKEPSLLDLISLETKEKIATKNVEIRAEGIRLSPPQDKLINAIMRLLHEKSDNRNEHSENFYSGNVESQIVPYGGQGQEARAPVLRIFPSELYKAYLDGDDYSGDEIKYIKSVLNDTEQQKFLIIYERKYDITNEKGKKEKRTDRIEDFQSLLKIVSFFEGLTEEEKKKLDQGNEQIRERRGELVIALNPLLTDQINSKYVEYPADINRRTVIASGGHRLVTESIIALRDYLLREISSKRYKCEINEDKIILILKLDKYLKQGRRKRIQDNIESSIQAAKNLGLITELHRIMGTAAQWKYAFRLNPKFE
jgi:hypothetical protein